MLYRVIESVSLCIDGTDYYLSKGDELDDGVPADRALLKARPDLFRAPNVEAATAVPGERRNVKRG